MNEYNSDWDSLYPFSAFLQPFKVPVPVPEGYVSEWGAGGKREMKVRAVGDSVDKGKGERKLRLEVEHPGLIWTGTHASFVHGVL